MDKKILAITALLLISLTAQALPPDMDAWCTASPNFKPGCLKHLATNHYLTNQMNELEKACKASLIASPLNCEVNE